jgi:voltage-dependent potassium channel beta subunit
MQYNKLGKSGLKVSELSFGTWMTHETMPNRDEARACIRAAFEGGVNLFDTAESYAMGLSESLLGQLFKDFRREELVVSTKLYKGGPAPNQTGLSRKHLLEGIKNSLRRLQMDYVDMVFCHRPDKDTPIEESILAMDYIVRSGLAFYWGMSEWGQEDIRYAYRAAEKLNCIPPTMEQSQYSMFARDRVESELNPLYQEQGLGMTIWSPLHYGILTGKYINGIPKGSRLGDPSGSWQLGNLTEEKIEKVKKLAKIADELGCSLSQLALAWCLKNLHVNAVLMGSRNVAQLKENIKAAEFKQALDDGVMARIETILQNKPK